MFHFLAAARVQSMTRLKEIHRRAHERINPGRCETTQCVSFGFTTKDTKITKWRRISPEEIFFVSFVIIVVNKLPLLSHAFPRRMRQIVQCEIKFFAEFGVKILKRGGQFLFDALARG